MKKILLLGLISLLFAFLFGCSSEEKSAKENNEAMKESYQEYDTHLQDRIGAANELLETFSGALDSIYMGSMSDNQFAKILKENIIESSNELVT
ncbi:hypothetical protein [Pontibacillus litoralis]|uniref:Uncharacterized protein n=1 Tax=Pontibacillus litoralis JSM 072002 TaxID=1385512 RepID=A0A0A5HL62_9BACI|nr:hypothetical protein [Pontibacillus litoralis]KGX84367.1 hypothetical protein N784_13605 [Pontibacillus litoralis JSM 072002]